MKTNLYIVKGLISRSNPVKNFMLGLFESFASYGRLILEVFVRSDFGERYFSLATALIVALVLGIFPIPFLAARLSFQGEILQHFLLHYLTWYAFLGYFIRICLIRKKEIKRIDATSFDTERFSLSHGKLVDWIANFTYRGKAFNIRQIETMIEPALFFIVGLALLVLGQSVGLLILFASIIYSLSYQLMYKKGDDFILDIIDNRIANRVTVSVFVDGVEDDPSGYRMRARRPFNKTTREEVADDIMDEETPYYAV